MLVTIIEERKKLFVDYNGSYDFYINHGGKQIPTIIVVINNYEAFIESYDTYEDTINQMTRDCQKYGVVFICTTNGSNTMRYRTRQNFRQNIVLQFNDPNDYASVLPGARKREPSKIFGRGLFERDGVYEYQTAYTYKEEKITDYIKVVCKKLNEMGLTKAKPIPILPEVVTKDTVSHKLGNIKTVPIGIEKDTLEVSTLDMQSLNMYCITGDDVSANPGFIYAFAKNILEIPNSQVFILDALKIFEEMEISEDRITYGMGNCGDAVNKLTKLFEEKTQNGNTDELVGFIVGISSLLSKVTDIEKTQLVAMFDKLATVDSAKIFLVDNIDAIKGLNYETWFKSNVDLSEGIWIGNGISNQFTLKVTTNSRVLRVEITDEFGYTIKKGKASMVKLMSDE